MPDHRRDTVAKGVPERLSGSAVADTAGIGNILIPSMIEHKYDTGYSVAVTSISSTIGIIFPPSFPMVIIGAMLGVSVGRLFLGGVIPGFVIGFALMFTAYLIARRKGFGRSTERPSLRRIRHSFLSALLSLLMPIMVVGGIVGGIVTPTEAGALAVTYALIVGLFVYRELNIAAIWDALKKTALASAKVFFVIATAGLYTWLLTANGFPALVGNFILSISNNPTVVMALIVVSIGVGLVTPPVGLCLYVAADNAKISILQASRALVPFILTVLAIIAILLFIPGLILLVPRLFLG